MMLLKIGQYFNQCKSISKQLFLIFYHVISKGLSNESIKPPTTSNKILNPSVDFVGTKARVKFNEYCLKQETIKFNNG